LTLFKQKNKEGCTVCNKKLTFQIPFLCPLLFAHFLRLGWACQWKIFLHFMIQLNPLNKQTFDHLQQIKVGLDKKHFKKQQRIVLGVFEKL
jgi:hypothetical protein